MATEPTDEKITTQGTNGKKPTGPRTPAGKLRASRNALKHGLFVAEFVLSAEEQPMFDDLRRKLRKELSPNSAVLELVFEDVVVAAWRMKLSLRCEQAEVKYQLATESEQDAKALSDEEPPMEYPYALTAWQLGRRLKELEALREAFESRGGILADEWEKPVSAAFGRDFWKTLVDWTPVPVDAILMGFLRGVREREELYGMEPLGEPLTPEEKQECLRLDTFARQQMMLKLLDLERRHLLLALHHVQRTADSARASEERSGRLDLFLRYQTTARREFYRALKEYLQLKKDLRCSPSAEEE